MAITQSMIIFSIRESAVTTFTDVLASFCLVDVHSKRIGRNSYDYCGNCKQPGKKGNVSNLLKTKYSIMTGKLEIQFWNVHGLRAIFFSVYANLCVHRPSMLAVCETQVCEDADPMDFHMPGYTFLSAFFPHRGKKPFILAMILCTSASSIYLRRMPNFPPHG